MTSNALNTWRAFAHDEEGATAIEYALIAGMISVILIVGLRAYAESAANLFEYIRSTVLGAL